ncbi:MAG: hypothetical protein U1E10_17675 [Bdellovibrionales bacterium]|nr:hypothetical protein [Bdellovibrionales bacterium]
MAFEEVKDQVLEALQRAKSKLDEFEPYQKVREAYDSMPTLIQKMVLGAIGFLIAFVFFLIPYSFYSSGSENLALFEENRDLVLDLYRVKRKIVSSPQAPPPMDPSSLESYARSAVTGARVQPEQIKAISFVDGSTSKPSTAIPKSVRQNLVEIRLANLNLTQIVDIGHALSNIQSTKVMSFDLRPGSAEGNYFDVMYKIVSFDIPAAPAAKGK